MRIEEILKLSKKPAAESLIKEKLSNLPGIEVALLLCVQPYRPRIGQAAVSGTGLSIADYFADEFFMKDGRDVFDVKWDPTPTPPVPPDTRSQS